MLLQQIQPGGDELEKATFASYIGSGTLLILAFQEGSGLGHQGIAWHDEWEPFTEEGPSGLEADGKDGDPRTDALIAPDSARIELPRPRFQTPGLPSLTYLRQSLMQVPAGEGLIHMLGTITQLGLVWAFIDAFEAKAHMTKIYRR
jgi:hypothetical protein